MLNNNTTTAAVEDLPAKIQDWFHYINNRNTNTRNNKNTTTANLSKGLDLTVSPSSRGASFPYSILPPLRHLTYEELINDFIKLPSVGLTAFGSFVSGVLFALGAGWLEKRRATLPLRVVVGTLASIVLLKWLALRFPMRQKVSKPLNVSDSPGGPCMVTGPVIMLTNSHAGTHADTPHHFMNCPSTKNNKSPTTATTEKNSSSSGSEVVDPSFSFHKASYTGDCIVLDISPSLHQRNTREIDDAVLQDALLRYNSTLMTQQNKRKGGNADDQQQEADAAEPVEWKDIWRLILCTKRFDTDRDEDVWKPNFPYFSVSGATFLATQCPHLLMIGTDSPSVDRSDATPLNANAHGVFWKHRIAIVENVNCAPLYSLLASTAGSSLDSHANTVSKGNLLKGQVQCVFNDAQKFCDAEGCNVMFYPME